MPSNFTREKWLPLARRLWRPWSTSSLSVPAPSSADLSRVFLRRASSSAACLGLFALFAGWMFGLESSPSNAGRALALSLCAGASLGGAVAFGLAASWIRKKAPPSWSEDFEKGARAGSKALARLRAIQSQGRGVSLEEAAQLSMMAAIENDGSRLPFLDALP